VAKEFKWKLISLSQAFSVKLKHHLTELRTAMQTIHFNDSWIIVDSSHETGRDTAHDHSEYSSPASTPDWFWTGRRWSSQSARCKLFASEDEAQAEMRHIRTAPNS
jgi:hypothetical protein